MFRRRLGGKRAQKRGLNGHKTRRQRGRTWAQSQSLRFLCMAALGASTSSSYFLGSLTVGWRAPLQAACGKRRTGDSLGPCLAWMHWRPWGQATLGLIPTTWIMSGWPPGTATAGTPTASAFWRLGMGGPRGRHCRWASLWKINNAFTSFARTRLRLDGFGSAVIWVCSRQTTAGKHSPCKASGLR